VALDVEADNPKTAVDRALETFDPAMFGHLGENIEFAEDYDGIAVIDTMDQGTGHYVETMNWSLNLSAPA
jgi:hypothetical protein